MKKTAKQLSKAASEKGSPLRVSSRKRKQVALYSDDEAPSTSFQRTKNTPSKLISLDLNQGTTFSAPQPTRNKSGELVFPDCPEFRPNLTPSEVLHLGSFGGTYFRPIYSSVTQTQYNHEAFDELPSEWTEGIDVERMVTSPTYRTTVNKYKVQCGQGLAEWESSGWITPYDPYGEYYLSHFHLCVMFCLFCVS